MGKAQQVGDMQDNSVKPHDLITIKTKKDSDASSDMSPPEPKSEKEAVDELDVQLVGNMELHKSDGYVVVTVNTKIYCLEVIYQAAYMMMDKAYVILDGNPNNQIYVELRPKDKDNSVETLGNQFNNELINYEVYEIQTKRNIGIRESIINASLTANSAASEPIQQPKAPEQPGLDHDPPGAEEIQNESAEHPEQTAPLHAPSDNQSSSPGVEEQCWRPEAACFGKPKSECACADKNDDVSETQENVFDNSGYKDDPLRIAVPYDKKGETD